MASPYRASDIRRGNSVPKPINPHQQVLEVAPLNSVPYIGPPAPFGDRVGSSTPGVQSQMHRVESPNQGDVDTKPAEAGSSMVFFPSQTTQKVLDDIMDSARNGIGLAGSAATGNVGPIVGAMDIGESDDAYLFRVSLPGVSRDEKDFSCDIDPDGTVFIKGVTTTGESTVCKHSQIFRMQTRNLCPPGHFSITFQLPGPVDHQQFKGNFGIDGMLEGIVKKR